MKILNINHSLVTTNLITWRTDDDSRTSSGYLELNHRNNEDQSRKFDIIAIIWELLMYYY